MLKPHQFAQRDASFDHVDAAAPEQNGDRQPGEEVHRRPEQRVDPREADTAADVLLVDCVERREFVLLLRVGLDDSDAREVFLGAGRDLAELILHLTEADTDDAPNHKEEDREQRHDRQRVECELAINAEHGDGRHGEGDGGVAADC